MKVIYNVKHGYEICLKFGGKISTPLTKLALRAKASICSTMKEKLSLYRRKFSAFVVVVMI